MIWKIDTAPYVPHASERSEQEAGFTAFIIPGNYQSDRRGIPNQYAPIEAP